MAELRVGSVQIPVPTWIIANPTQRDRTIDGKILVDGGGRKFIGLFKSYDLAKSHASESREVDLSVLHLDAKEVIRNVLERGKSAGARYVWFDYVNGPVQTGEPFAIDEVIEALG